MPTGHTTKKTLTPYRASLLDRLQNGPVQRRSISSADRRQFNDLCLFGWADDDGQSFTLTGAGASKLAAYRSTQAA